MVDLKARKHPDDTNAADTYESCKRRHQRLSEASHGSGQIVHQHVERFSIEEEFYPQHSRFYYLRFVREQSQQRSRENEQQG